MTHSYEDRINRVTAYIYEHLDEPLDLQRLADVAAMSPWHWHDFHFETAAMTDKPAIGDSRNFLPVPLHCVMWVL